MKVAALFVDRRGPYWNREDVDAWDIERDARSYNGDAPAVAHPPCHLWVNMAAVNWKRYQRQIPAWYPGGSDGGCFAAALAVIMRVGGVIEHPAFSHAWEYHRLTRPLHTDRWTAAYGNEERTPSHYWVCEVWQSAYGHQARKRTWLLYVGDKAPPELNWSRNPGTHQVGWFDRIKPTLSKAEASRTPPAFAELLIGLARLSRGRVTP